MDGSVQRTSYRFKFSICFYFFICLALRGQVQELWRSELPDISIGPFTNYWCRSAAVDSNGNTLVGGAASVATSDGIYRQAVPFIAKFDNQGRETWTYISDTDSGEGVQSLATDRHGNTYFVFRSKTSDARVPVMLVKLAANGSESWRTFEGLSKNEVRQVFGMTLKLDTSDNPIVLYSSLRLDSRGSETATYVAKFSPQGGRLWRTKLPMQPRVIDGSEGAADALAVSQDGGFVIVGGLFHQFGKPTGGTTGFVTRLDSRGHLLWFTSGLNNPGMPDIYSSVAINKYGFVCAAGLGTCSIFGPTGRLYRNGLLGMRTMALTEDNDFTVVYQTLVERIGMFGQLKWSTSTSLSSGIVSVVPDNSENLLLASGVPAGVNVTSVNRQGNLDWSYTWSSNSLLSGLNSFLKAPDGTYRAIFNLGSVDLHDPAYYLAPKGIAISALSISSFQQTKGDNSTP
jgi:hypothetical protein